ncbi:hypothetical protein BDY21DRAFT_361015 [Lineolata rhizophorae]|uniref:Uncharacterized protein n=1 Tax=Lineolata rhizophorae TaxID=578093 RepID=A0A6A6PAR9_9PEZI|nr:hypothetical protein BDY21DRAFT_361015 [Lineolata rhizophorae]
MVNGSELWVPGTRPYHSLDFCLNCSPFENTPRHAGLLPINIMISNRLPRSYFKVESFTPKFPSRPLPQCVHNASPKHRLLSTSTSRAKDKAENEGEKSQQDASSSPEKPGRNKTKTMAEMDEEVRMKMEGRAGDGGEAGRELEGGKAVSMKRGVRDNMFRYI